MSETTRKLTGKKKDFKSGKRERKTKEGGGRKTRGLKGVLKERRGTNHGNDAREDQDEYDLLRSSRPFVSLVPANPRFRHPPYSNQENIYNGYYDTDRLPMSPCTSSSILSAFRPRTFAMSSCPDVRTVCTSAGRLSHGNCMRTQRPSVPPRAENTNRRSNLQAKAGRSPTVATHSRTRRI